MKDFIELYRSISRSILTQKYFLENGTPTKRTREYTEGIKVGLEMALIAVEDRMFPTAGEAAKILRKEGFDTSRLESRVNRRLCDIKGHDWEMSWPLDPVEHTCRRCGEKSL